MKKILTFFISVMVSLILIVPTLSFSSGIVPCNNTPQQNAATLDTNSNGTIKYDSPCDFDAFMTLINNVIRFILFDMAVPIAAIMFLYAGFLLITAGGEAAHARTKAKSIFTNAIIGLAIAVAAWLIVRTVLSILGYNGAWIGF